MLSSSFSIRRATWVLALGCWLGQPLLAAEVSSVVVKPSGESAKVAYEGTVEAVRQAVLAAQVAGNVVQLNVKAGDLVKAGQLLVRLDARAADQGTQASVAQVGAARAALDAASKELDRKRQLLAKNYISQAAMEQAEAQYKISKAQLDAQQAQVAVAQTQTGFYGVKAPFSGVVSAVTIELGDMAMPGRALVTVVDPSKLRVSANLPVNAIKAAQSSGLTVEVPGAVAPTDGGQLKPDWLPTVDPQSLTRQVRVPLAGGWTGLVPGMFARVWVSGSTPAGDAASPKSGTVKVPVSALVRRSEMVGVYVLSSKGQPLLRQVRTGVVTGDEVELLSGVEPGEKVVTNPQVAARQAK